MHHMAWDDDYIEGTERFAALVAAAEREKCAEICDNSAKWSELAYALAATIRARGESEG
jgi:hypothetical protein